MRDIWDEKFAASLIGKTVLVGMTYVNAKGAAVRQKQFWGVVERADPSVGVRLALQGKSLGEHYDLPPDLRGYDEAPPGEYRLRSTHETVVNPDYVSTWTVDLPTKSGS